MKRVCLAGLLVQAEVGGTSKRIILHHKLLHFIIFSSNFVYLTGGQGNMRQVTSNLDKIYFTMKRKELKAQIFYLDMVW